MPLDQANLTETQQVLLRAAEEVRKGWRQHKTGRAHMATGSVCVGGALVRVTGLDFAQCPAYELFRAYLKKRHPLNNVVQFNDTPGRTAEEVASALEAAAFSEGD